MFSFSYNKVCDKLHISIISYLVKHGKQRVVLELRPRRDNTVLRTEYSVLQAGKVLQAEEEEEEQFRGEFRERRTPSESGTDDRSQEQRNDPKGTKAASKG